MSALPAVTRPIDVQRRLVELGRIRLGQKAGGKGAPQKLDTFRLTSASRNLLDAAAVLYGGEVHDWTDAPDAGYFQLTTKARELEVLIPPTLASYSQWYELWDAGGCARRCDGAVERISGQGCLCDPEKRTCKITTRVSVMLPRLPGLGVWRLDSHGWNAATTLPSTIELLGQAAQGGWVRAILRAVAKSKRVRVDGKAQTHRWIEPQLDVPESMDALMAVGPGTIPAGVIAAATERAQKVPRPALPPGPEPPSDAGFRAITSGPDSPRAPLEPVRATRGQAEAVREDEPPHPAESHAGRSTSSRRTTAASPGAAVTEDRDGPLGGPAPAPDDAGATGGAAGRALAPASPDAAPDDRAEKEGGDASSVSGSGPGDREGTDPARPLCGAEPPADDPLGLSPGGGCEIAAGSGHRVHRNAIGTWSDNPVPVRER